ncbi:Asp23/Gls24 family envelope stress response protein [Streptomyces alkaliterrae]|uniref:Asp23/Gls24 family envelope stress response protein n=1 Tax=Streptomyces alkaliterrae TaxID=2213162 RepID=A0A5P0YJN7_9ACTN|nr:Asp23/Gls24 family envelope stress response protein [Streptomyces alkaliterrae]MBB1252057.1 Asp23/Gls24 family envelope stress response protein [Streptomyces alkaliterrae]MBB1259858.1 Asp23/Gls24 family envelope stress response protein [Streptomyces alkaliterrae]MQS00421.1 Asp23/Gls24 family envelope stress response protein [Streptomyces alkaliterrae]
MAVDTVPARERGALAITDRVVAKIAAQAAHEALRRAPGGAGRAAHAPHAAVAVRAMPGTDNTGGRARVRVAVELDYPCDIAAWCAAVRRRVGARLAELAGMTSCEVVVEVQRLHAVRLFEQETEGLR